MMKLKRALTLSLLAAILLQTAACGETGSGNDQTTDTPSDTTAAVAADSEYTRPDVNYNGKTVTLTGYAYEDLWAITRYNIGIEEENGDIINDAIVRRNRAVEETLGVNIEMVPLGKSDRASSEILQKYIYAQEDVITVGMQMYQGLSQLLTTEGMLVDLKEIPTLDLTHSWWNQNANEEYALYGKQLTAVGDIGLFNLGAPVVIYFSKGLIEQNQLDNPYQLVYDGKWTFDTMEKMAVEVANDVNGNTKMDESDIFGFGGERASIEYFFFSSGIRYSERNSSGDIEITLNNEKAHDMTEKVISLLRDTNTTIYGPDWMSTYTTSVFSEFMMPKLANSELLFFTNQLHVSLSLRDAEYDFGIVPMPKYDEEQEDYISFANGAFSDHIVVPSTNTDLELVGHLLEAMGYYAQQEITPAFIDSSVKSKGVRDEDSVKMIDMILDNQIFDIAFIFKWGSMSSTLQSLVTNSDTNFASMWASIESAVETDLEKTVSMLKGE